MVKFTKNKAAPGGGPSSAIGITRFFDADSKSPKLSPYFVVGATIVFIAIILVLAPLF
ncbi:MAG: preprotein translocase subunit Sec61beta [Candidatus Diapherotrites archaeon]|jgi:preprotein translocase subunit Sec61beta|nr:preprotein translocase subunit Sec61beta [Candidatus Diapherotrites archaeon]MBT4597292.1 preprotein translocase subunit Sec61beta [Candidatus Diapherotrites archaeon]